MTIKYFSTKLQASLLSFFLLPFLLLSFLFYLILMFKELFFLFILQRPIHGPLPCYDFNKILLFLELFSLFFNFQLWRAICTRSVLLFTATHYFVDYLQFLLLFPFLRDFPYLDIFFCLYLCRTIIPFLIKVIVFVIILFKLFVFFYIFHIFYERFLVFL